MKATEAAFNQVLAMCAYLPKWKPHPREIKDFCRNCINEVPILHFSGHAGKGVLQLNADIDFLPQYSFTEGLSEIICSCLSNLKLVFLNGCSTREQAKSFLDHGVSAVIASNKPVRDVVASKFAKEFYEYFLNDSKPFSLQKAFHLAKSGLTEEYSYIADPRTGLINPKLLDADVRNSLDQEDEDAGQELYELHLSPEAQQNGFARQTFFQWVSPSRVKTTVPVVGSHKAKTLGLEEAAYLLCDRADEAAYFQEVIHKKIANLLPEPYFFVVHELEQDCPQLLPERIRHYGIPKEYLDTGIFNEIEMLHPRDFGPGDPFDPANTEHDKFKIRLSELYRSKFGGTAADQNKLCTLVKRPDMEPLLIVHHVLSPGRWQKADDVVTQQLLRKKLEAFFDFYVNEYSEDLQYAFSKRLIVIFSVKYMREDDFFPDFFEALEKQFSTQHFRQIGALEDIDAGHVDEWQTQHLHDSAFIEIGKMFSEGGQPVAALPFLPLIPKLRAEIRRFNEQYSLVRSGR